MLIINLFYEFAINHVSDANMSEMDAIIAAVSNDVNNNYDDEKKYKRNAKMSEMDAIINNYDEKKYKEESSTAYETSSPQQTEYISDSFLPFHKKKLESKRISKRGVLKKFYDVQIIILNFKSIL